MLVFPHWRSELPEGCRVQRWMPAELGPYLARPAPMSLPMPPTQYEDDECSGGSSPERAHSDSDAGDAPCGWRGCGARFPSVARLSAHVARTHAHAHADGLFYCGWSNCARPQRGFNARYKMLVHVRTHTNERPHTCSQCQKSFSRAENLKIHLRSHSGEKPYVCPYEGCGKAYSNSSDRFKHTRTHAVEKPYCCKIPGCNKRYTDPSSLRKHVKTYKHFTNEKNRRESSEETVSSDAFTNIKDANTYTNNVHTYQTVYSPKRTISPLSTNTNIIYSQRPLSPVYNSIQEIHYPQEITYIRPDIYQRVPDEMSHIEYTHMYDHAYRNYYNINYPVLRPTINEKVYTYEGQREDDIRVGSKTEMVIDEELPLNLITKRLECRPIEQLVKCTDYPLDLSTKS